MKYATVCSGIEAPSMAWHGLGWKPVWFSEIDRFPSAVLKHHYAHVPNLGDMTKITKHETFKKSVGTVDLFCGGTPCQSFSVAGLRKGMDDPRGNLALVFLGIVDQLRPRWVVWENVPGVLSSNGGRDFGSFVGALGQLGYGWAYRILDAQYFGVPQRRRRVFVVGHIGGWQRAAAVLFERHSLQGHLAPRRETGKGFAADVAPSLTASGRGVERTGESRGQDPVIAQPFQIANCLTSRMHKGINSTVDEGQTPIIQAFTQNTRDEVRYIGGDGQVAGALAAETGAKQQNYLAFMAHRESGQGYWMNDGTIGTLRAEGENRPSRPSNVIQNNMQVRRLTPRECERLQGFPDDFTKIPYRGKSAADCPDGPRYKALGNSMAVPVMEWIGKRIKMVDEL